MAVSFKGAHFPKEIILTGVRWYLAYPLSTRHVEELMLERGVRVDHSTINRWVVKYSPQLEEAFHRRKRPVYVSWRMEGFWRVMKDTIGAGRGFADLPLLYQRTRQVLMAHQERPIYEFHW
jgi:transposase-like protein